MVLSREYLESFVCGRFKIDPHCREGHIHILAPVPGTEVLGLHTPEMKEIAKEFVRGSSLPSDIIKLYVRKARESLRTRNIAVI